MGWSISGGVRFTTSDIFDITTRLGAWRGIVRGLTRHSMMDVLAKDIQTEIDVAMGRGNPLAANMLSKGYNEIQDAQREIKKTGYRNPKYDFDFEISIMPFDGAIYGIVRSEQESWRRKFMASGLVKPFSWHDNERPSHIPSSEWKAREAIWKKIFEGDSRPIAHGFNAELTAQLYEIRNFTKKDIARMMNRKSFEERVRYVAKDHVMSTFMQADPRYNDEMKGGSFAGFFRATDHLKTDEGQAAIAAECIVVTTFLIPKFDETMI